MGKRSLLSTASGQLSLVGGGSLAASLSGSLGSCMLGPLTLTQDLCREGHRVERTHADFASRMRAHCTETLH